ncbi:hypothetical protein C2845_PM04G16060 [Panicum miliaceum]|uniref:Ubiquitin-like protease family profile domain-containing protein n=1 Tax=Panicum miliaceum TaxID=4540 RepID=A0A3L6QRS9_PANMI|nr:hypothetical protein C2845_PM04G16060 [Panicum miliaceum]
MYLSTKIMMPCKRPHATVDLSISEYEDGSFEDVLCSKLPSVDISDHSFSNEENGSNKYSSSDDSSFNHALFDQVMRDFMFIKKLKHGLSMSSKHQLSDCPSTSQVHADHPTTLRNVCNQVKSPKVQILGSKSLNDRISGMVRKSGTQYNAQFENSREAEAPLSVPKAYAYPTQSSLDVELSGSRFDFKVRNPSTGGKAPAHGPRRAVFPSRYLADEFDTKTNEFLITKSEIMNYNAICSLASSRSSGEDVVQFGGVRCTFWSLGESLKPGGYDNLLRHPNEANEESLLKAFKRSSKTRPLSQSDLLFFPTFHENHWSLCVVGIKDSKFVFLDSYFRKDDDYQVSMREQLHWESPRSILTTLFDENDIANIWVKIANCLLFSHRNVGRTDLVISFDSKGDDTD